MLLMKKLLTLIGVMVLTASWTFAQKVIPMPEFSSDKEKAEWIENNKQEYNILNHSTIPDDLEEIRASEEKRLFLNSIEENKIKDPLKEVTIMENDSGFPKYVITGNKELDDENYRAAKDAWIMVNQEKYNALENREEGIWLSPEVRNKMYNQEK